MSYWKTNKNHWLEEFPMVVEALSCSAGVSQDDVASDLALIAGDYNPMGDDEILATYINEVIGDKK